MVPTTKEIKVPRKSDGLESLTRSLLNYGISRDNIHNWKAIMLLLELFYQQSDIRRFIIKQLREVYNYRLGEILDSLNSFQLANYLIELIINCFPKKHNIRATLSSAPKLWTEPEKTKSFFSDELYPHRAKHGEDAIIQLILKRYGSFFTHFGSIKKAVYITGKSSGIKTLSKHQSYMQVIHHSLYFWDGEGLFFEINPKKVDIVRDLRDTLKITLTDTFSHCVLSPHSAWLATLNKTTSFQFQSHDPAVSELIWNATKLPKISEVQTYISLRFPSSYDDGIIESSIQEPEPSVGDNLMTIENGDNTNSSFHMGQVTDHYDTPEKPHDDTVEKPPVPEMVPSSSQQPETPRKLKLSIFDDSIEHDQQSPLAIAQKRKIVRATSKTLEVLKEDFNKKAPMGPLSSCQEDIEEPVNESLARLCAIPHISKDTSMAVHNKKVGNVDRNSGKIKKVTDMFKATTTKKKDVSILDDIFALPLPRGNKKKVDKSKQTVLNNFKPIVYVPSQDVPPAKSKMLAANNNKISIKRKAIVLQSTEEKNKRQKVQDQKEDIFALSEHGEPRIKEVEKRQPVTTSSVKRITRSSRKVYAAEENVKKPLTTTSNEQKPCFNKKNGANVSTVAAENELVNSADDTRSDDITIGNDKSIITESSHTDISMFAAATATAENTTISGGSNKFPSFETSFTNQLQEQIYHSVMNFSNELTRKISLINGEMNKKIINELSEKYKTMFKELQSSFQNDVEKITGFVGEIKDMLHLPEEALVKLIRDKQFHS